MLPLGLLLPASADGGAGANPAAIAQSSEVCGSTAAVVDAAGAVVAGAAGLPSAITALNSAPSICTVSLHSVGRVDAQRRLDSSHSSTRTLPVVSDAVNVNRYDRVVVHIGVARRESCRH